MPGPTSKDVLRFDVFELDVRAGELRKRGVKQRLKGQPVQVLAFLLKRAGDVVTREELRAELWQSDTFVDFDHSLHNAVARIREVLGDSADSPRFVETLPRRGYRFLRPVDNVPADSSSHENESPAKPIRSLAVLPLEDHSGEQGHEYFADSMTEALITSLAKIHSLRVISRTSAMQYKGVKKSLPQIARELNVDAVIEGSILRAGDRVRIAAQLILASTDEHLWAETYERDFRDILSLQSDIARQIAAEVRIKLTPQERERLTPSRRVHPEAYEQYLMGRYHWNKRSESGVEKALRHFQRAIDLDPTYAQGYAGLADSYNILGYYNSLAPQDAYPKARAAAGKAIERDAALAEPHASLGVIKRDFEWDWAGAEQAFQRAIELDPAYTEAYHWRSTLFSMLGRTDEALRQKAHALTLDPLSVVIQTDLARMHYFHREYEKSIQQYRRALEMDPHFSSAHLWLAQVLLQTGNFSVALEELETGKRLAGDSPYALAKFAYGYAITGATARARDLLAQLLELSRERYVSPYDVALIHLALKDSESAHHWLQKALEQRSIWLGYLKVEPQLDSLRSDPRFGSLLAHIRL